MTSPAPTPATANDPRSRQDRQMETAIGLMLRSGVLLAATVMLIGGILFLAHTRGPAPDYHSFHPGPASGRSIPAILHTAFHAHGGGRDQGLIQLGALLLIATPVARVVLAMAGFARERDWLYTLVSAIVLATLTFSLLHTR